MKRFIQKILELKNPLSIENKNELKENRMLALVAALLHDIGHGPLRIYFDKKYQKTF